MQMLLSRALAEEVRARVSAAGASVEGVAANRSITVTEHAVLIAGGGPTGLMLAVELELSGRQRRHSRAARHPGPARLARRRSARHAPSR